MGKEAKYVRADTLGSLASGPELESMNFSKPWSVSILSTLYTLVAPLA